MTTPVMRMEGRGNLLEVFEDKVAITPKGLIGLMNKGLKGTKSIPYYSITAIQFKECGIATAGYIQFTIPGGVENTRGLFAATKDENSFIFHGGKKGTQEALRIKAYVETQIAKLRAPAPLPPPPPPTLPTMTDELVKLAGLRDRGLLTDEEFAAAKARLIGG